MELIELQKDLFNMDLKKYTLVHCISYDCEMGKGIAKTFNEKYPNMKTYLKRVLSQNHYYYPVVITHCANDESNTVIYNLITKEKYWHKPTYETITKAIEYMRDMCLSCSVKYIAMPRIGCGLDKLEWDKVKSILKQTFKNIDIQIVVCSL